MKEHYSEFKKRKLREELFSVRNGALLALFLLFLALAFISVVRFENRKKNDDEIARSRIETVVFDPPCKATLTTSSSSTRVNITLNSVKPKATRVGAAAVLDIRVCNPNDQTLTIPRIVFKYSTDLPDVPGILWTLPEKTLGIGYCNDYSISSAPLGELIRFTKNQGRIEIYGQEFTRQILELPDCCPPPPTPIPTPTPTPAPSPTPTPVPPCGDVFDKTAGNVTQFSAARLTDGAWRLQLCPATSSPEQQFGDVDWFYFDYQPTPNGELQLFIEADDSAENPLGGIQLRADIYQRDLKQALGNTTGLGNSTSLKVKQPGPAGREWFVFKENRRDSRPKRFHVRVSVDKRFSGRESGISYSIRLKGSTKTTPVVPTPTPRPTRTPTPTPSPTRIPSPTPTPTCEKCNDQFEPNDRKDQAVKIRNNRRTFDALLCQNKYSDQPYEDIDWYEIDPPHESQKMVVEIIFDREKADIVAETLKRKKDTIIRQSKPTPAGVEIKYTGVYAMSGRLLRVRLLNSEKSDQRCIRYSVAVKFARTFYRKAK